MYNHYMNNRHFLMFLILKYDHCFSFWISFLIFNTAIVHENIIAPTLLSINKYACIKSFSKNYACMQFFASKYCKTANIGYIVSRKHFI